MNTIKNLALMSLGGISVLVYQKYEPKIKSFLNENLN